MPKMSQHLNSMLEHLRIGSLIRSKSTSSNNVAEKDDHNGTIPKIAATMDDADAEPSVLKVVEPVSTAKRHSISVHSPQNNHTNGDVKTKRELSPSPNRQHRKSSHDIRAGLGIGEPAVKPLKVKHISSKAETYDMLHSKATEVSVHCAVTNDSAKKKGEMCQKN
jgi:rhodanese-related sulfurtransferase